MTDVHFYARKPMHARTHVHLFRGIGGMRSSLCNKFAHNVLPNERGYEVQNKDLEKRGQLECKACWEKARKLAEMVPAKGGAT